METSSSFTREQQRGTVSSNSRCQTVLFQQYSANLSPSAGDYIEFKSKSTDAKWRGRLQAFGVNVVFVVFFVTLYLSGRLAVIPEVLLL